MNYASWRGHASTVRELREDIDAGNYLRETAESEKDFMVPAGLLTVTRAYLSLRRHLIRKMGFNSQGSGRSEASRVHPTDRCCS